VSERALRVWRVAGSGGKFKELVKWGAELEARGRELAARREEPIGREDYDWFSDLSQWHEELRYVAEPGEGVLFTEEEARTIRNLHGNFVDLFYTAEYVVIRSKEHRGLPRKTPIFEIVRWYVKKLAERLKDYDETQKKLTGKTGIWLLGAVPLEQYTWSAFLNDVTSSFHRVLTWLTMKFGDLVEVAPNVYASSRSLPVAVECATMWREATLKYVEWGLYAAEDFPALAGVVRENKAEFVVGSSPGHATHAEFYPLYATAEYYDTDEKVHEVFIRLSQHYGCEVAEHREEEVTVVRIPRSAFADFFRGVLPFVTSMDYRLYLPDRFWGVYFREEYERLRVGLDKIEREFRLCITAYERLKRAGE
jgi:hypothetical protein